MLIVPCRGAGCRRGGGFFRGSGSGCCTYVIPPGLGGRGGRGRRGRRRFRSLPARLAVYFVLGTVPVQRAAVRAGAGAPGQPGWNGALAAAGWAFPAVTALTGARRRLGEAPLERLFRALCSALSPGRRAVDAGVGAAGGGVGRHDARRAGDARRTRRRSAGRARAAATRMLRVVTLVACGTRGLLGAAAGPGEREGHRRAGPGRPADRGAARRGCCCSPTGASTPGACGTPPPRPAPTCCGGSRRDCSCPSSGALPDGSWLSRDRRPAGGRATATARTASAAGPGKPDDRSPLPGITVRVIEFTVDRHRRRREGPHPAVPDDHHPAGPPRAPRRGAGRRLRPPLGHRDSPTASSRPPCAAPASCSSARPRTSPASTCGPTSPSTRPSAR